MKSVQIQMDENVEDDSVAHKLSLFWTYIFNYDWNTPFTIII